MNLYGNKRNRLALPENTKTKVKHAKTTAEENLEWLTTGRQSLAGLTKVYHSVGYTKCQDIKCPMCYLTTNRLASGITNAQRHTHYVIRYNKSHIKTWTLGEVFAPGGLLYEHKKLHRTGQKNIMSGQSCLDVLLNTAKALKPNERVICSVNKYEHVSNVHIIKMRNCDYCATMMPVGLSYECECGTKYYCNRMCHKAHREHDDEHNSIMVDGI